MSARLPEQQQRADALRRFFVLDAPPERPLYRVTRLAGLLFDVDHVALVTMDNRDRRLRATKGFQEEGAAEGGRDPEGALPPALRNALLHPTRGEKLPLYTEDASTDPRFEGHPLLGQTTVRFYASAPLKSAEGYTVGVLKVFDAVPRELSGDGLTLLTDLAAMAESELNAQRQVAEAEARAQRTARLDAFAQAVGKTAERFLRAEDWQNEAARALQHLGEAVGAQAVQVYVNHTTEGRLVAEQAFAWGSHGAAAPALLDYEGEGLQRWAERLAGGACICEPRDALPEAEQALLDRKQAQSIAVAPLCIEERWAGFLCFDFARAALAWAEAEVDALRAAAEAFGAVLERDRREREVFGAALLDATATPLLVCVREEIALANPAALRLVGRTSTEALVGARLLDLVPTEMHTEARAYLDRCYAAPASESLRVRLVGAERRLRVVDLRGAPTTFRGNRAVLLSAYDVTRYEEELREATDARAAAETSAELVSALMTGLNQEVRTPLTSILGYAELLAGSLDGANLDQLGVVRKSGQQLSRTIEAVYELARLSAGGGRLAAEPVSLAALLDDAEHTYAPLASARGVRFILKPPPETVEAVADRVALTRVLGHLITNALQFTDDGYVELRVRTAGPRVHLEIEDTGCGISEAFLPSATAPFRRERRATDHRNLQGTGLGLTLADLLLTRMGGTLSIKSKVGEGTLCRVALPLHAEALPDYRPASAVTAADGASVDPPVPRIALPDLAPPVQRS